MSAKGMNLYKIKLGFTGVYIFLTFARTHRLCVLVIYDHIYCILYENRDIAAFRGPHLKIEKEGDL